MDNKEGFRFTYSAARQQEVERIRSKYLPRQEDKMEQLRALHACPTRRARHASILVGITGALVMGTGMSLVMTELGAPLGEQAMVLGICVGIAGMALAALAYPVYNRVLRKQRKKIAPKILQLTDELLG